MFELTGGDSVPNGHGFGDAGMSDQDIWDIVAFLQDLVIDTDPYIDGTGAFLGDSVEGETEYHTGGSPACVTCHGVDGAAINFGTPNDPVFLGTIPDNNPWELLHKIRL